MPIQTPQWTEFLTCPICYNEFEDRLRQPISLGCGHTVCKACLSQLHKTQCPFDQASVNMDINKLPVNTALLQLVGITVTNYPLPDIPSIQENASNYRAAVGGIEELAMYLRPLSSTPSSSLASANGVSTNTSLTRPMQRKLVTLVNCQLAEEEGQTRAMRAARSLGERTVTELILLHQNPQQLSANLWAAVRARGCQFLGPAMQEEALKYILLALEGGESLSRKVLVLFVVQRLEPVYTQASKTSIGHVVQLLYRASCFKVTKRDDDSSLMQLKEQFRTYDSLRKEHDAQIVQIAMEAGLRISPDQWSSLLYGELEKKSHMQSIIDKLQSPSSFSQSIQELIISLQRSSDPGELSRLRAHFELLSEIDTAPDAKAPSWDELEKAMQAVHSVVQGLVSFSKMYGSKMKGSADPPQPNHNFSRFKTSMCRDHQKPGGCPRGATCSFAHSEEELDKFGGRGQRRPVNGIKSKPTVVARGPSGTDQYLPMENGSVELSGATAVTQASQMNGGSARSSPLCVARPQGDVAQGAFTQPQYQRGNPDLTQRMKQMTLQYSNDSSYTTNPSYESRAPYANGDRANYYPNGTFYGHSPPLTVATPVNGSPYPVVARGDLKGTAVPPHGILTPRSSPLTTQEDTRENGLTNGHSDPGRRQPSRMAYDPQHPPRAVAPGYGFNHVYRGYAEPHYSYSGSQTADYYPSPYSRVGAYEQVSPIPTVGYVPTCRRDVNQLEYYQPTVAPPGMFDSRNDMYHDGMMNGIPVMNGVNGRYRDDGRMQRRSPYIPTDTETSDSPRSDFGDEIPEHQRSVDEWLRDLKALRKDTSSSGVSSGSPLSHSPTASQSSRSSRDMDSPLGWQPNSDNDKIWHYSESGPIRPLPGIPTDIAPIWTPHKQSWREVRKLWQNDHGEQISKDEELARELQEAENGNHDDTTSDMAIIDVLKQLEKEEEFARRHQQTDEGTERAMARREQEEKDRLLALETQKLEQYNERERLKKIEHERLLNERRKLLLKQTKESQEMSDLNLARRIAIADAKEAGFRSNIKPIGFNPGPLRATYPQHGNTAFGPLSTVSGFRNGCGPPFADDDVMDAPKMSAACNGDIYVQE